MDVAVAVQPVSAIPAAAASASAAILNGSVSEAQVAANHDNDKDDDALYWFRTSGQDLARMMYEANYPVETSNRFLTFYRDVVCPLLGGRPQPDSLPTAVGWDGNPFEYSFEFKGSTKKAGVRFVLDLSEVRPANREYPLSLATVEKVLDVLSTKSPLYDDHWHRSLERWFVYSHKPSERQRELVAKVGYQTPTILGFDINPKITELAPALLPVMVKSYFPPCFVTEDRGFTRFRSLALGVRQLPDIGSHPNILLGLKMIEDFVADNPQYEGCGRGLSTDFVPAGQARLKVYLRYWGDSFDEIWDYYTLGGRIPIADLEDDKEKLRDLIQLSRGSEYPADKTRPETEAEKKRRAIFGTKPTSLYFSLTPEKPYPIPKLYFYPAFQAPNDEAIAQGIDTWLKRHNWYDGGKTLEEMVANVFDYRRLDEKPGIFTFLGVGRKETGDDSGLSLQVYVTPELYESPRY
ncbi:Putative aromatic prenyltransferase [Colletotrichum destructivum]|uniref:Aromatic prenyltransferase n=1 Tax=Colletotrichum destructivum TaxID=34406 RepID=A0AAX4IXT1_9PEZI|nr:Putative aromatic prenyltransferase [Colletotrichum destructivum]